MLTNTGLNFYRMLLGGGGTCNADNSGTSFSVTGINGTVSTAQNIYVATYASSGDNNNMKLYFGSDAQINRGMTVLSNMSASFQIAAPTGKPILTDNGNISTQSLTIPNNTAEAITYTCFGVTNYAGYPANTEVLVSVFMLDAPVTIPAGESKSIEIKFDYSNL